MSGGPPHHPHGRQVPTAANPAWNHLQVPNFFPARQPQHAHMSNDHSFLHQPTWHTPTTESMKAIPHSHIFSLEQMLSDRQFNRHAPGVDLSVTRNGSQNGDIPTSPISLSVRDANKINSLPPSALEVQAVELTKCPSPGVKPLSPGVKPSSPGVKPASPGVKPASPGVKPASPGMKPVSPGLKSSSPGLKSVSPSLKSVSPGLKSVSPGLKSVSPGLSATVLTCSPNTTLPDSSKNFKRANKRVDSLLERLNPTLDKNVTAQPALLEPKEPERPLAVVETATAEDAVEKPSAPTTAVTTQNTPNPPTTVTTQSTPSTQSVIVQASVSSHDENSSSSSIVNVPTPTNTKEDDVQSPCSNEDSLDSNKSRRKRKPAKTVRVSKEDEKLIDSDTDLAKTLEDSATDVTEIKTVDPLIEEPPIVIDDPSPSKEEIKVLEDEVVSTPAKTRRKTSSESETLDDIAAMVQEAIEEKKSKVSSEEAKDAKKEEENVSKPITVSVIKTKENLQETLSVDIPDVQMVDPLSTESSSRPTPNTPPPVTTLVTPAQKKATNTHFVEVENKLEEMFAGIEDTVDPLKTDHLDLGDESKMEEDSLLKLGDSVTSVSHDISSSSIDTTIQKSTPQKKTTKKAKVKATAIKRPPESVADTRPKKKKKGNKKFNPSEKQPQASKPGTSAIKGKSKKPVAAKQPKVEVVKDVYAYDSGSNASSNKSKGPFIHIRGPRDSPISVNVVNTPTLDEDAEKKTPKTKKYHDDSEYRHKVRSKGLHSSTLSNKYDAQTRDVSWICAFCKRGPHGSHSGDASQRNFDVPLGDLFGPYVIGTSTPEFERKMDDPYDKQFKSKKIVKMIELTSQSQPVKLTGKKGKRKYSDTFESRSSTDESDIYLGITDTGNNTYEVWAHEECIVWSLGVYLVGSKIVGLEEAVWTACNVLCSKCKLKGANICCLNRSCTKVLHYCCAKSSDWVLDEENFKAYCSIHKITP